MKYIIYEQTKNKNLIETDDFNYAFKLCFLFNQDAQKNEKYDIKKIFM